MPSTYSTNLKLELMATGEKNNLWGGITNTNLGSLLEEAIVGAATVAMADANQTITITNGASSTGRCVYIQCTGALTAGRNLTVPTVNKNYIVENATTGGFDITVKTGAGTGIAVKPSTKRAVYADATNVVEAISGFGNTTVTGTLAVSSTLAVAGASTLTGAVTGGTYNKVTVTAPAAGSTLTIADGKTLTASNTLAFAGTDGTTITLPPQSSKIGWFVFGENNPAAASTSDFINIPASINHLMAVFELMTSGSLGTPFIQTYDAAGVLNTGGTDYYWNLFSINTTGASAVTQATTSGIQLAGNAVQTSTPGFGGDFTASNIQALSFTKFNIRSNYQNGSNGFGSTGYGVRSQADRITGVRFTIDAGTFTGKITLMASY